ncbi:MAG: hypothetical protein AAFV53_22350 [Myxococcota bacterium]
MKAALWVIGGLCIGSGILLFMPHYGSGGGIGVAQNGQYLGQASQKYYLTGYDTVGDIAMFSQGWFAILLGLTGVALMVYANANAWKDTNGY